MQCNSISVKLILIYALKLSLSLTIHVLCVRAIIFILKMFLHRSIRTAACQRALSSIILPASNRLDLVSRSFSNIQFSRLPPTEEELYAPHSKPVTYISEYAERGAEGFKLVSKHFPNSWGFLWHLKKNGLTPKIMSLSKAERKDVYNQLAARDFSKLRQQLDEPLSVNGLLPVAGEEGKAIISEAYSYLGVPPLVSYKNDLLLMNLKNKFPLGWIPKASPVAFNIHPAPPDKRGAGVYVPSLVNKEKEYAVTVHILNGQVDDGAILFVKRFPIPEGFTRTQLYELTSDVAYSALEELLLNIKLINSQPDVPSTCHVMWGDEITRGDVKRIIKELVCKFGERGHPALI